MRSALLIFVLLSSIAAIGQSKLTGVRVSAEYLTDSKQYQITERLYFDTLVADKYLTIKRLLLEEGGGPDKGETPDISTNARIENTTVKQNLVEIQLKVLSKQEGNWLEVKYVISEAPAITNIPLFFTELSAASSDEQFFQFSLNLPAHQSYYFHFPSGPVAERPGLDGQKQLSFTMPALPSVVRLELMEEDRTAAQLTTLIDIAVALIFGIIAVLIWAYRKKLIYG